MKEPKQNTIAISESKTPKITSSKMQYDESNESFEKMSLELPEKPTKFGGKTTLFVDILQLDTPFEFLRYFR